jgi:hypothetical protein
MAIRQSDHEIAVVRPRAPALDQSADTRLGYFKPASFQRGVNGLADKIRVGGKPRSSLSPKIRMVLVRLQMHQNLTPQMRSAPWVDSGKPVGKFACLRNVSGRQKLAPSPSQRHRGLRNTADNLLPSGQNHRGDAPVIVSGPTSLRPETFRRSGVSVNAKADSA